MFAWIYLAGLRMAINLFHYCFATVSPDDTIVLYSADPKQDNINVSDPADVAVLKRAFQQNALLVSEELVSTLELRADSPLAPDPGTAQDTLASVKADDPPPKQDPPPPAGAQGHLAQDNTATAAVKDPPPPANEAAPVKADEPPPKQDPPPPANEAAPVKADEPTPAQDPPPAQEKPKPKSSPFIR